MRATRASHDERRIETDDLRPILEATPEQFDQLNLGGQVFGIVAETRNSVSKGGVIVWLAYLLPP